MSFQEHFQNFAAYNRWANRRLYQAAATLPHEDYRREIGVFFGSLRGTLNHLLVGDRIWMRRLTGSGEAPARLDAILHDGLDELTLARIAEDERIVAFINGLREADLDGSLDYTNTTGAAFRQKRREILAHLFNHQTHHRGQAHAALTRLGMREPPPLDLLFWQREQGRPAA
jgi:uncharacterized damage-inducible protein DinB